MALVVKLLLEARNVGDNGCMRQAVLSQKFNTRHDKRGLNGRHVKLVEIEKHYERPKMALVFGP